MAIPEASRGLLFVRAIAALLGGWMLILLTVQLFQGEIRMSVGEVVVEPLVLDEAPQLLVGYLMWATFFSALLIFGLKPALFYRYSKLGPIMLGVVFVTYVLLNLLV